MSNKTVDSAVSDEERTICVFNDLSSIPAEPPFMRRICPSCRRPETVCWCPYLPKEPIKVKSKLIVLQHPNEVKKCLRTCPIIENVIGSKNCLVFRGKRFPGKHDTLHSLFQDQDTIVLYPAEDATPIEKLEIGRAYNIVIIDGTWPQAKAIYNGNKSVQKLRKVQLDGDECSKYVIRTQPSEKCLSTVESAAVALSILEESPEIKDILLKPLLALCQFQLNHGAVHHHSKEFKSITKVDQEI